MPQFAVFRSDCSNFMTGIIQRNTSRRCDLKILAVWSDSLDELSNKSSEYEI